MNVLITYVSRAGSTLEIAARMQTEFAAQGMQVETKPAAEVADLSIYDAVIAGGLLYRLGWHPDLVRFLRKHRAALGEKKSPSSSPACARCAPPPSNARLSLFLSTRPSRCCQPLPPA